ncbi:MAG: endonuclease/exonuclease/phosphatase family protein [Rhodobacter sp.]|nr:endonuclease/exonuclease/phosphatase family protein [Rhodobacter sp.]
MAQRAQTLLWPLFGLASLALAASHLGALHALGDSLAVFRLHFVALAAALALALAVTGRRVGLVLAVAAVLGGGQAVWGWVWSPGGAGAGTLTVYQKNLSFRLADPEAVAADILAAGPDIVTLQEVTGRTAAVLDALAESYPTQLRCPFAAVGGVAVASRFPAVPGSGTCAEGQGLAALRVETPSGPVTLASLHLHWPWPYRQRDQLRRLLPHLAALTGPVVLGGDFNMVPWSHTVRRVEAATGALRTGPARPSFPRWSWLPLPIDHVLAPGGTGQTQIRPRLGSDHRGLLARVGAGG